MANTLNGEVMQKVIIYGLCILVAAAWGFLSSRASDEDVKALEKEQREIKEITNKRLRNVETNSVKICQFLDRQDRAAGGPGLDCKDAE